MSEQCLNASEICPVFQQMGSEAVPELMRTYRQLDRSILDILFEDDPDRSGGKALTQFLYKIDFIIEYSTTINSTVSTYNELTSVIRNDIIYITRSNCTKAGYFEDENLDCVIW